VSVYANFTSLPNKARITMNVQVMLHGTVVRNSGVQGTIDRSDTGEVWQHASYRPEAAGTYTVIGTVSVGKVKKSVSATFQAAARPQPAATPVPPPTLVFTSLKVVNARQKPTATFFVGGRATVVTRWTAQNVRPRSVVVIAQTLQYRAVTGWKPLGRPVQDVFDAASGSHFFQFSFVPQTSYNALRIVTSITMGSISRQRSVTIQVRP
jgi:hypothetical protein